MCYRHAGTKYQARVRSRQSFAGTEEDVLLALLDYLAKRRLADGSVPLLTFLVRIAPHITDPLLQQKLILWIKKHAEYLHIDTINMIQPHIQQQKALDAYLLIKIESDLWQGDAFFVKGWLFRDAKAEGLSTYEEKLSLADLPRTVEKFLAECHNRLQGLYYNLTVELILPRNLLCHDIDQWKIAVGKGLRFPIGAKLPRCREVI